MPPHIRVHTGWNVFVRWRTAVHDYVAVHGRYVAAAGFVAYDLLPPSRSGVIRLEVANGTHMAADQPSHLGVGDAVGEDVGAADGDIVGDGVGAAVGLKADSKTRMSRPVSKCANSSHGSGSDPRTSAWELPSATELEPPSAIPSAMELEPPSG